MQIVPLLQVEIIYLLLVVDGKIFGTRTDLLLKKDSGRHKWVLYTYNNSESELPWVLLEFNRALKLEQILLWHVGQGINVGNPEGRLTHHKLGCVLYEEVGGLAEVYISHTLLELCLNFIMSHFVGLILAHMRLRVLDGLLVRRLVIVDDLLRLRLRLMRRLLRLLVLVFRLLLRLRLMLLVHHIRRHVAVRIYGVLADVSRGRLLFQLVSGNDE